MSLEINSNKKTWTAIERAWIITTGLAAITSFTAFVLIHLLNKGKAVHTYRGVFPATTLGAAIISSLGFIGGIVVSSIRAEKRRKAAQLTIKKYIHRIESEAPHRFQPLQKNPPQISSSSEQPASNSPSSENAPNDNDVSSAFTQSTKPYNLQSSQLDKKNKLQNELSNTLTLFQTELSKFIDAAVPDLPESIHLPDFTEALIQQLKPEFDNLSHLHQHLEKIIINKGAIHEKRNDSNSLSQNKLKSISELKESLEKVLEDQKVNFEAYHLFLEKALPFCKEVFGFIVFLGCKYDMKIDRLNNLPFPQSWGLKFFLRCEKPENLWRNVKNIILKDLENKKFKRYFPVFSETEIPTLYADSLLKIVFHLKFYALQNTEHAKNIKHFFRKYAQKIEIKPKNMDSFDYYQIMTDFIEDFSLN